ncbi:MAG: OmpH family outer membrane protein [Elusimicrobiota bacterium]
MRTFTKLRALAACALLLGAAGMSARALEISLEENKAERGNIGFVDIQKIFRLYPETHKAKQTYKAIVRQAEEQVNLRRGEMITLRAELSRMKMERDLLEKASLPAPVKPAAPAEDEALPPVEAPARAPTASTTTTVEAPVVSTGTLATESVPSTGTPTAAIAASTAAALADAAPRLEPEELRGLPGISDKSGNRPVNIPGVDDPMGDEEKVVAAEETPTHIRARLLDDLDGKINAARSELEQKEAAFAEYQSSVEKNLIEIEGRRTEILLGKIYTAVREVAQENGVSIVVDKNQILYGQTTVDLTAKVLQKLKGFSL